MLRNCANCFKVLSCVLRQNAMPATQARLARRWSSNRNATENSSEIQDENNQENSTKNAGALERNIQQKFSVYRDEDSSVILDQLEEQLREQGEGGEEEVLLEEVEEYELLSPTDDPFYGLNLQRGVNGVFDVDMLVEVLRGEKANDICVIKIPREKRYASHLVICSALSYRHLVALTEFVNKLYKKKRHSKDPFLYVEGKESKNWFVMDMGNIVLHLFMPGERSKYDLESLWCLDFEFDDKSQVQKINLLDKFEQHLKYLQQTQPTNAKKS